MMTRVICKSHVSRISSGKVLEDISWIVFVFTLIADNDFSSSEAVLLPERIHQLLRHVIVTEGILERQIEKVVGLNYISKTVSVSLTAKVAAFAINIDVYVLRQLRHILQPATFGIAIAYKPSYRLALTRDGVQYRR